MNFLNIILIVISAVVAMFTIYVLIPALGGFKKPTNYKSSNNKAKFGILIAARNEEKVIGNLIESLKAQTYPKEKMDIFVLLNNSSDKTKEIAQSYDVNIYECHENIKSKGDALSEFFDTDYVNQYDAFCVFDADNVADKYFVEKMNDAFQSGVTLAQGYRDSKNPKDSWLTSSYSIYFWALSKFLSCAHDNMNLTAFISGTGCMVSSKIIKKLGFNVTSITEDLEFTVQNVLDGTKVKFINDAKFYDEHTTSFYLSLIQRKRWTTGMFECSVKYSGALLKKAFKEKNFTCFDLFMHMLFPVIQLLTLISYILLLIILLITLPIIKALLYVFMTLAATFVFILIIALLVPALVNKKLSVLNAATPFLFWLFLLSYLILNAICIFAPSKKWTEITHNKNLDLGKIQ